MTKELEEWREDEKQTEFLKENAVNGIGWCIERLYDHEGWKQVSETFETKNESLGVLLSYIKFWPKEEFRVYEVLST